MSNVQELHGLPRPVLVLAHPNAKYRATVSRSFRRLKWSIATAESALDVRRLARLHSADVVVLAADLAAESGWLTCEKLRGELPGAKVVLVADEPSADLERFAQFVGATALVSIDHGPAALLDLVGEPAAV
jgi:ActR/RegA family two-component response regulator